MPADKDSIESILEEFLAESTTVKQDCILMPLRPERITDEFDTRGFKEWEKARLERAKARWKS